MLQSKLFKPFFVTLFIFGIFNTLAIILHLFWAIMWFDMLMHFSGGFFVSIATLWIITINKTEILFYGKMLLWGVIMSLFFGVLWECFELYFDLTNIYSIDYIGDNGMDIVMDVSGGLVAVWYSYFKLKNSKL
jgi:hypothetical protein